MGLNLGLQSKLPHSIHPPAPCQDRISIPPSSPGQSALGEGMQKEQLGLANFIPGFLEPASVGPIEDLGPRAKKSTYPLVCPLPASKTFHFPPLFMVMIIETKAGLPGLANKGTGRPGKLEEYCYLPIFCNLLKQTEYRTWRASYEVSRGHRTTSLNRDMAWCYSAHIEQPFLSSVILLG